ncbi:MAG: LacI family DNA-binding transcriptional regulator [Burkholderiales bacterium]|nr:LacI family DNA-binding transcriptional regulator [Opitutaceae bacterium]
MPLPSIRLIADKVGLSKSAVSLALRHHPSIPLATREKVEAMAAQLGYRANPLVAALMTQQRSGHAAESSPLIVFIDYYGARAAPRPNSAEATLAREAAEHLQRTAELFHEAAMRYGYQLDYLKARDAGMTPGRLAGIVKSRGARGVVFLRPAGVVPVWLDDWDGYCVVELGGSGSGFHEVKSDKLATCRSLLSELAKLGYRRPGLAIGAGNDQPGRFIHFAFSEFYEGKAARQQVAAYLSPKWTKADFLNWCDRTRPDVVVSTDLAPLRWLREEGVKVPEEIGFACTDLLPHHKAQAAGMDGRQDVRIRAAVTILDGLLRHNERGRPEVPLITTVVGHWHAGPSVRALAK